MTHSSRSTRTRPVLFVTALILSLILAAAPAFAADPEEADPDPGFTGTSDPDAVGPDPVTQVPVGTDPAELSIDLLALGRYVLRIVDAWWTTAIYEIVVASE